MNIVLAPDGPLHAGATLARYHLWGEDPANRLADGALLRVLRRHGRLVPYEVRPTGSVDDARLMVRIARARDAGDTHHQTRSEEHTSELQSQSNLVCRLLLEKKNTSTA